VPHSSHRSIIAKEAAMTSDPRSELPPEWVSDKEDLDALFKDAKPIGDGSDWASQDFFESDEDQAEFVESYRAERHNELA
jgi:hypothetical protein